MKDTTDSATSALYLDLHLEIDNEVRLRTKYYGKGHNFNFPIVNLLFMCSNIPNAPISVVYISQLTRYSKAFGFYHNFIDRGMLLTWKLVNQGCLVI